MSSTYRLGTGQSAMRVSSFVHWFIFYAVLYSYCTQWVYSYSLYLLYMHLFISFSTKKQSQETWVPRDIWQVIGKTWSWLQIWNTILSTQSGRQNHKPFFTRDWKPFQTTLQLDIWNTQHKCSLSPTLFYKSCFTHLDDGTVWTVALMI